MSMGEYEMNNFVNDWYNHKLILDYLQQTLIHRGIEGQLIINEIITIEAVFNNTNPYNYPVKHNRMHEWHSRRWL